MRTAKIFEDEQGQVVRLPKEYRFDSAEVAISKIGEAVILVPKEDQWAGFLCSFDCFTADYMSDGRDQLEVQERDLLLSNSGEKPLL